MEGFLEEGTTELDLERLFQAWAAPPAEHKGIKKTVQCVHETDHGWVGNPCPLGTCKLT